MTSTESSNELQQFITDSLVQIANGVKEANTRIDSSGDSSFELYMHQVGSKQGYVHFDIAVTVSQGGSSEAGGGLAIHIAKLGASVQESDSTVNASRIEFDVRIGTNID